MYWRWRAAGIVIVAVVSRLRKTGIGIMSARGFVGLRWTSRYRRRGGGEGAAKMRKVRSWLGGTVSEDIGSHSGLSGIRGGEAEGRVKALEYATGDFDNWFWRRGCVHGIMGPKNTPNTLWVNHEVSLLLWRGLDTRCMMLFRLHFNAGKEVRV